MCIIFYHSFQQRSSPARLARLAIEVQVDQLQIETTHFVKEFLSKV